MNKKRYFRMKKRDLVIVAIFSTFVAVCFLIGAIFAIGNARDNKKLVKRYEKELNENVQNAAFVEMKEIPVHQDVNGYYYTVMWEMYEKKPVVVKWEGDMYDKISISLVHDIRNNVMRKSAKSVDLSSIYNGREVYDICSRFGLDDYENANLKVYDLDNDVKYTFAQYNNIMQQKYEHERTYEDRMELGKELIKCSVLFGLISGGLWFSYAHSSDEYSINAENDGISSLKIFLADITVLSKVVAQFLGFISGILIMFFAALIMMALQSFWLVLSVLPLSGVAYGIVYSFLPGLIYRRDLKHVDKYIDKILDNCTALGFIRDKHESVMQIDQKILEDEFVNSITESISEGKLYEGEDILITNEHIVLRHYLSQKRDAIVLPKEELGEVSIVKGKVRPRSLSTKAWIIIASLLDGREIRCYVAKSIKKKELEKMRIALLKMNI